MLASGGDDEGGGEGGKDDIAALMQARQSAVPDFDDFEAPAAVEIKAVTPPKAVVLEEAAPIVEAVQKEIKAMTPVGSGKPAESFGDIQETLVKM